MKSFIVYNLIWYTYVSIYFYVIFTGHHTKNIAEKYFENKYNFRASLENNKPVNVIILTRK